MSDKDLVNECIEGKPHAWNIFYKRFKHLISSIVKRTAVKHRIFMSEEDLNDCEQFIWASFFENDFKTFRRWEERCSLATWVRVCSGNATINFLKSKNKIDIHEIYFDDLSPRILHMIDQQQKDLDMEIYNKDLLKKVINIIENHLNDRERLFASLFWYRGVSYETISRIMNLSIENLHLLKHRTMKKIKRLLKKIHLLQNHKNIKNGL